ncbi:MAG: TolC family protein, partial [Muribaculaceae bacterium]|nr:TolC family protein [Muribaculaceae bacterium]
DTRLDNAYSRLRDNQVVQLGMKIPLVDWGKRRGQVKVAESNREVTATRLRREQADFRQDIFILVERFNNQREQVNLAASADRIAQQRYDANVRTFLLGKISTLYLNDSQVKKDQARSQYIRQLYLFWYYYYQIRALTLWDFEKGLPIDADFENMMR